MKHKRMGFDPWVGKIPWRRARAIHSNILAWRIPWAEEPGGLQSMGSHRFRQDWSDLAHTQGGETRDINSARDLGSFLGGN